MAPQPPIPSPIPVHQAAQINIVHVPSPPGGLSSGERRERCKLSTGVAALLGIPSPLPVGVRFQIRVGITAQDAPANSPHLGKGAVYSVDEIVSGSNRLELYPSSSAGSTNGGSFKLFDQNALPAGVTATLWNVAVSSTKIDHTETVNFAELGGDGRSLKETLEVGTRQAILFAPHGRNVELKTSEQLARMKGELAGLGGRPTVWDCRGAWGSGQTFRRWHVTSTDITPASFPALFYAVQTFGTFQHAVALHGFSWDSESHRGIVIGGRATRNQKLAVKSLIETAIYVATGSPSPVAFYVADQVAGDLTFPGADGDLASFPDVSDLGGTSPANLVNRLSSTGIQLEQSLGVRNAPLLAGAVADGTAWALAEMLGLGSPAIVAAAAAS